MKENNETSEYITFPKTFENYKWYKPILVLILGLVIMIILDSIITLVFSQIYGKDFIISLTNGGYEILNTEIGEILTNLGVIIMIPSLYLASKIVRDRPFSSYVSSRGGWNYKLYFKALIIPFIMYMIFGAIDFAIKGPEGIAHFSWSFLILTLILVPLQCIAEEYVFRGLFMQTFGSWFGIPVLAVILQAIIFALCHGYNNLGIIEVFVSGLFFGFITWKTNGIEVSSAVHTANNFTISLFVMLGIQSTTSSPTLTDAVISIAFLIILYVVMYYVGKKTDWFGEIKE
ncbi:CPBP family intramembrane glutamic endopeptidase [Methanobrevibacter sp.]|uniref:CPBP family intramembrane glutamic endopeptidase n=1 Tax=Methanobrevibacter sp. TaxID=66852 RepID=UPI00388FE69D